MKTAEQRAEDFIKERCNGLFLPDGTVAMQLARSFKEYARDQRHLCAEAMNGLRERADAPLSALHLAFSACMDAPEPGKERR